jgi:hypothetical protein
MLPTCFSTLKTIAVQDLNGVHPYHAVEADAGGEEYYQNLS